MFVPYLIVYWKQCLIAAAIVAVVAGAALYRKSLINEGWDRALKKVEQQNDKAAEAARRVQRTVDQCYDAGGVWSTITGDCSR